MNILKSLNGFSFHEEAQNIGLFNSQGGEIPITPSVVARLKQTMVRHGLTKLRFGSPFSTSNDISFLKDFPFLTEIIIGFNDFDPSPLLGCTELEVIRLEFPFKGQIDFTCFPKLHCMTLNYKGIGTSSIFGCQGLEDLFIIGFSEFSMDSFVKLRKLKRIVFTKPKLISVQGVEELQQLEVIEFNSARQLKNIEPLAGCDALKEVHIRGCKKIQDMESLMYLRNIRTLTLEGLGEIPTIGFIKTLKNLQELYLTESTNIADGDLSAIAELKQHGSLQTALFRNRRHYTHTIEDFGFKPWRG